MHSFDSGHVLVGMGFGVTGSAPRLAALVDLQPRSPKTATTWSRPSNSTPVQWAASSSRPTTMKGATILGSIGVGDREYRVGGSSQCGDE
jgi:hypothetical protein